VRAPSLVESRLEGNVPPGHATCPTPMRSAAPRGAPRRKMKGRCAVALHGSALPEMMRASRGEARCTRYDAPRVAPVRSATQDKGVNHSAVQSTRPPEKNHGSGSGSDHEGVVHESEPRFTAARAPGGTHSPRALSTATTAPEGVILLSAGLWRAVLLPLGQRLPAPPGAGAGPPSLVVDGLWRFR